MTALQVQTLTSYTDAAAAAVQGANSSLVNMAPGSVALSLQEANASMALWLQWLILQTLLLTRAQTSNGPDLDSFYAPFGFGRLGAVAATGAVTFSRYTATSAALIMPGSQVKTLDGTQTFVVTTNTTNSLWNAGLAGYLIPSGTSAGSVPVQALVAGTGGNIQAGTLTIISSAVPFVDTVTNTLAFTNGVNAESDVAYRARFVTYFATLTKGTDAAVIEAATSIQAGTIAQIFEDVDSSGNLRLGYSVVVLDDGTGAPNSTLLTNAAVAVQTVRAVGEPIPVVGPTVTGAHVVIATTPPSGTSASTYTAAVQAAVTAYIDSLGIGATLNYSQIGIAAAGAAPSGTTFTSITLNGGFANLPPTGPISASTSANMGVVRAASVVCT